VICSACAALPKATAATLAYSLNFIDIPPNHAVLACAFRDTQSAGFLHRAALWNRCTKALWILLHSIKVSKLSMMQSFVKKCLGFRQIERYSNQHGWCNYKLSC
jgi:hypothetical protein